MWTFSGFPPYIGHRVIVLAHVRQLELLHLKLDSLITIGGLGSRYLDQANRCRRGKWLVLKDWHLGLEGRWFVVRFTAGGVSKFTSSRYFRRLRRLLDSIKVVRNSGYKESILSSFSGDSGIDLGIFDLCGGFDDASGSSVTFRHYVVDISRICQGSKSRT